MTMATTMGRETGQLTVTVRGWVIVIVIVIVASLVAILRFVLCHFLTLGLFNTSRNGAKKTRGAFFCPSTTGAMFWLSGIHLFFSNFLVFLGGCRG